MMNRILIADDEAPARGRIRRGLAARNDCEIAAECADGASTLDTLLALEIDVLFLDVQMPELTGFEVLAHLPADRPRPAIIFTTAYDEHALEAFAVCAVDYLLKPWKEERFHAALDRALAVRRAGSSATPGVEQLIQRVSQLGNARFAVRNGDTLQFLHVRHIDHVEADGNYVILHHRGRRHLHRETLGAVEQRLAPHGFFRATRSHLVNLHHIREIATPAGGPNRVILENDAVIPLTRSVRDIERAVSSHQDK